jgi:hypothetical protein
MPDPGTPQDAGADPGDPSAAAESSETEEPAGYANRAARRARGKGAAQPQPQDKGSHFGRRGAVQGPRQWGNRRSG